VVPYGKAIHMRALPTDASTKLARTCQAGYVDLNGPSAPIDDTFLLLFCRLFERGLRLVIL